jgi:hypothetical protein
MIKVTRVGLRTLLAVIHRFYWLHSLISKNALYNYLVYNLENIRTFEFQII